MIILKALHSPFGTNLSGLAEIGNRADNRLLSGGKPPMKFVPVAILTMVALFTAHPAAASVYTDDLAKCLVAKTSDQDKIALVQWVFVAISASPGVKDMANVTPQRHEQQDRAVAVLFERLLEIDCRKETVAAVKYDGSEAIKISFGLLGQVAMKVLMSDPSVDSSISGFTKYLDAAKLGAVLAEGGLTATPPSMGGKPRQ